MADSQARSRFRLATGSGTNARNIKASPGKVYRIALGNMHTAPQSVQLYDLASTPTVGSTVPFDSFICPPQGSIVFEFPEGIGLANGIAIGTVSGNPSDGSGAALVTWFNVVIWYD